MKIALLNTTICTTDGLYEIKSISLNEAKQLLLNTEIDSAVGHQTTADVMTQLLGINVPMNRQMFLQEAGQTAIVFKLNGRPPEGAILSVAEIEAIGYSFKTMVRMS